jgi:long-chain fatty acid transport protein
MKGRQLIMGLGLAAGLALPLTASATNGYFAHGYGTANKGLAGAGVALPQDAQAPATNPAGITRIGHRVDAGVALFSPRRDFTAAGFPSGQANTFPMEPGSYASDSEYFLIPHFGYNRPLDGKRAFGVAVYGNGGMNTDWPNHPNPLRGSQGQGSNPALPGFNPCVPGVFPGTGTYCAGGAGVDYMQLFIAPTYAFEFKDDVSLGASLILAYHRFEATGISTFGNVSNDPTKLSDNSHDDSFGAGLKVGVLATVSPTVDLGLSLQSKIDMGEVDDYAGLFAEEGNMDIPPTATVGIAWKTSDRSTLVADLQWIGYEEIDAVSNPMMPAFNNCAGARFISGNPALQDPNCLGGSNGIGFGWEDMTILKLGYQWNTSKDWTWRVGYSYTEQPIPSSEVLFNILAPGVMEHHFTFGFSKKMAAGGELHFAALYAPEQDVRGPNPLDPNQTIELSMYQFELELGYTWHFD